MAQVTGTFSANGLSAVLRLRPNEQATISLSTAGADTFVGTAIVEQSDDHGGTWTPTRATDGTLLTFTGTAGGGELGPGVIAAKTVENDYTGKRQYRIRVLGFADDDLLFTMADVVGEAIFALLRDRRGEPVLQLSDSGEIIFARAVVSTGAAQTLGQVSVTSLKLSADVEEFVVEGTISAADIVGTGAGQFGHAAGYPMLADAAVGADEAAELVSCVLVNDRDTAAYTDGGNTTVNWSGGGAALTGVLAAAAFLGAATDTRSLLVPLAAAALPLVAGAGLHLVAAAAFTQPGTAAGVVRYRLRYRIHQLGLA